MPPKKSKAKAKAKQPPKPAAPKRDTGQPPEELMINDAIPLGIAQTLLPPLLRRSLILP